MRAIIGIVVTGFFGEIVQYEDKYRLCYIRGPEGIIVALAQQLR